MSHVDSSSEMNHLDDQNIPVYGTRILFGPKRKPNLNKYILWTDSVQLTDLSCYIHGLFNFDSRSDIISANQFIALNHWEFLLTSCNALVIVPSIILKITNTMTKKKERKRIT